MTQKFISPKATCIVFYDFDFQAVDFRQWFEWAVAWFTIKGSQPVRADIGAEDIKWRTVKTFKHVKKVLEKREFKNIEWIALESEEISNSWSANLYHANITASIRVNPSGKPDMGLYAKASILPFEQEGIWAPLSKLAHMINPRYGLVHQREYSKDPRFYTWGTIVGLDSDKYPEDAIEEDKIAEWSRQYYHPQGKYHTGLLREIYPLNLLSHAHLSYPVGNLTLEQWILSSSDHGELKTLTKTLWTWWVPEDKIPHVTNALKDSQIIICI